MADCEESGVLEHAYVSLDSRNKKRTVWARVGALGVGLAVAIAVVSALAYCGYVGSETSHASHSLIRYDMLPNNKPVHLTTTENLVNEFASNVQSAYPFKTFSDDYVKNALKAGVDWVERGAVVPAKNQGSHGYCGTFGRVAAAEGQWALAGNTLESFSEEQLVDCIGWDQDQFSYFSTHGFMRTQDYPYNTTGPDMDPPIPHNPCRYDKNKIVPGTEKAFTGSTGAATSEDQLAAFVFKNGPVQTGINANVFGLRTQGCESTKDCFITVDMCNDPSVKDQPINHSITLVGFGEDPKYGKYWNVKNSWSTEFGNDGFIKVAFGVSCGHIDCCGNVFTVGDPAKYYE